MYSTNIDCYKIIFIGRPAKAKGLTDLLNALNSLKGYNWILTIVGEVPTFDTQLLQDIKEKRRIICLGPVNNTEICKLLNQHHIIVVPSHYENFGQVVLEAMACGKAIIASRTGGLKEIIKNWKNGIHFTPKDYSDLSTKLKYVFDNQQLITTLGNNALKDVKKYSWENVITKTLKVFSKYI